MPRSIPVSNIESGVRVPSGRRESGVDAESGFLSASVPGQESVAAPEPTTRVAPTRWWELAGYLLARKTALAGLIVFLLIAAIAILAPLIAPHDPLQQNLGDNFKPPMWEEG